MSGSLFFQLLVGKENSNNFFKAFLCNFLVRLLKRTPSKVAQKNSNPLFFPLLPGLPKQPKQKNSCSKMWLKEQLYIELSQKLTTLFPFFFQMFVRLFVDENLDRHVPISKQPKEKIQAIIDSCTRQFPEFAPRARKRIRTYLKSCRRTKRSREQAGLDGINVRFYFLLTSF